MKIKGKKYYVDKESLDRCSLLDKEKAIHFFKKVAGKRISNTSFDGGKYIIPDSIKADRAGENIFIYDSKSSNEIYLIKEGFDIDYAGEYYYFFNEEDNTEDNFKKGDKKMNSILEFIEDNKKMVIGITGLILVDKFVLKGALKNKIKEATEKFLAEIVKKSMGGE